MTFSPLRSRGLARPLAALVTLVLAAVLTACVREGTPQLIQVLELAPHEAEVGDRVEILGAGFPQGRVAHLAFRGTLFRPGERPIDDAEILAEGTVRNAQQIEMAFTEALQASFCGPTGEAAHTTFAGELEVAFSAASPTSPPVAATLYKVELDVRPPPPRAAVARAQEEEGERALKFIGVVVSPEAPPSGGLAIDKVEPGSRADLGGLVAGDVLAKIDGVRVASKRDVVPPAGAQTVALTVRRGSEASEQLKHVAFDGFKATAPAELLGAAIVLALAAAIVLLFFAPSGRASWIERGITSRLRELATARALPVGATFWLAGAAVSAVLVVTPFAQLRAVAALDVGVAFVVLVSALVTAVLVTGGGAERWTFGATVAALWQALSGWLAAAVAVAGMVVVSGSLRLHDIVRAQGGAPWDWYAFRSPITVALFAVFVAGAFAQGDDAPTTLEEAAAPPAFVAPRSGRARAFAAVRHAALFVACAIAVALFLGGWQIPGLDAARGGQSGAPLVGGAIFVAKTWALALAVVVARRVLPPLRGREVAAVAWKYLVPVAIVALALAFGWRLWSPPRALERMSSGVIFVAALLVAVHVSRRVRYGLRSPHAHAHVNPFL